MTNEQYNDLFVTSGCLSQQQLLDYVQHKLSPEQQHEVERHLADCELCSEAVEGLQAIRHKEKIPVWLRQMKWEMIRKLRKRNRRLKAEYYIQLALVVIVILFLLLAAFWIYHFVTSK